MGLSGVTEGDRAGELIGEAVSTAVRRAVEEMDRTRDAVPEPALEPEPEPEPPAEVIDLTVPTGNGNDSWARQLLALDAANPDATDPYDVFGLPRSATWDEILITRKRLARAWHPDAGGSESALRNLNVAFSELRVRRGR